MNEDGNNFAPQGPIFSSPDTPPTNSNPAPAPQAPVTPAPAPAPTPAPEQPTYTNPFATTEISTEPTAPTAPIVSTSQEPANSTRHMFNSRRFKDTQAQAAPTQFAGAPDFFNQAAAQNAPSTGDIVIGDQPQRSGGKGKMIAVVAAILLLAGGGVAAGLLIMNPTGGTAGNSGNTSSNNSEADVDGAIDDLAKKYDSLLTNYSEIKKAIYDSEYREGKIINNYYQFSIGTQSDIENLKSSINSVVESKKKVDSIVSSVGENEKSKAYAAARSTIESAIAVMESNANLLGRFNDAYYSPLDGYVKKEKETPSECSINDAAKELVKDGDSKIAAAAKQYEVAFCKIVQEVKNGSFSGEYSDQDIMLAKKLLIECFKTFSDKGDGREELNNIKIGWYNEE